MRTIKTYLKVGAFYIACEEDFPTSIRTKPFGRVCQGKFPITQQIGSQASIPSINPWDESRDSPRIFFELFTESFA
jgi:hypothetical protein